MSSDFDHVDGLWGKPTAIYQKYRRFYDIIGACQEIGEKLEGAAKKEGDGDEVEHAFLTILGLADRGVAAAAILCNSGYASEARVHSRSLFEHWVSALYVSMDPISTARLYNINHLLNLITTMYRMTTPEDPIYQPTMPNMQERKEWALQAFGDLREEFGKRGIPFYDSINKLTQSQRRGWAGIGIADMVAKLKQHYEDSSLSKSLNDAYEYNYKPDCQFVHSAGISRAPVLKRWRAIGSYLTGPTEEGVEEALYATTSNFLKLLIVLVPSLCPQREKEMIATLSGLASDLAGLVGKKD